MRFRSDKKCEFLCEVCEEGNFKTDFDFDNS